MHFNNTDESVSDLLVLEEFFDMDEATREELDIQFDNTIKAISDLELLQMLSN